MSQSASAPKAEEPGLNHMADGIGRYWFVAAVFRDPMDLAETIGQMRADGLAGRICVVANHTVDAARQAVGRDGVEHVGVLAIDSDGAMDQREVAGEPTGMRVLLECMDGKTNADDASGDGTRRPHVYAQLHEDVRAGAFVLIASVNGPEEQVLGARLLLKGNCECVLTHEIEAPAASA